VASRLNCVSKDVAGNYRLAACASQKNALATPGMIDHLERKENVCTR
jgi:hypothetical protein